MADENRQFDQQVHDAFERIELSEGAQDRILANLLAAQVRKQSGENQEHNGLLDEGQGVRASQKADGGVDRFVIPMRADEEPKETVRHSEIQKRKANTMGSTGPVVIEGSDADDDEVIPFWRKRFGWRKVLPFAAALAVTVVVVQATIVIGGGKHASEAVIAPKSDAAHESKEYDSVAEDSAATPEETSAEGSAQSMATNDSAEPEATEVTPMETEESTTDLTLVDHCPLITLEDGTQLTALRDGLYTEEVSPDEVGELVSEAVASPGPEYDYVIPCTVYALKHESEAYAVRYKSETTYWRCEPME